MSKNKKQDVLNAAEKFLSKLKNVLNPDEAVNFDFKDAEGVVLFSTDKEDDSLAVGDAVTLPDGSTDGTFMLEDGRTVTIADGLVSEIVEASSNEDDSEEVANLQTRVEELENALEEAQTVIVNLKGQVGSSFNAAPRNVKPKGGNQNPTVDEIKNELKEKRNQAKGVK